MAGCHSVGVQNQKHVFWETSTGKGELAEKNSPSFWKATLKSVTPKARHSSYHSRLKLSKSLENLSAYRTLRKFFGEAWRFDNPDMMCSDRYETRFDVGCSRSLL